MPKTSEQAELPSQTAPEQVATGLDLISDAPAPEPQFIQIAEPEAPPAPPGVQTVAEPARTTQERTWAENKVIRDEATTDDAKRRFYEQIVAAREPKPEAPPTQPVAPRVAEQTQREMEAGAAQVAKAEAHRRQFPPPPPDPTNGMMTAVFRPDDYVPDQKKGQGLIPNTTNRTL